MREDGSLELPNRLDELGHRLRHLTQSPVVAERLVASYSAKHPNESKEQVFEAVIDQLERDRR
jgi:hypothetical protein